MHIFDIAPWVLHATERDCGVFTTTNSYYLCPVYLFVEDVSKDAVEEMLITDEETADALAEFDFVMGEDSGSETDTTVIEVDDNGEGLEDVDIHMPLEEPTTQG